MLQRSCLQSSWSVAAFHTDASIVSDTQRRPLLAGNPILMLISALLFTLIAWDIFGSGLDARIRSFYLLPHYVDWPVHAWVKVGLARMGTGCILWDTAFKAVLDCQSSAPAQHCILAARHTRRSHSH